MLALTHDAATAIRGIIEANDLPEESGLRITVEVATEAEAAISLAFAEPEADDTVVAEEGVSVFLDEPAAELLEDKVLDAAVVDDGIAFSIRDQSEATAPSDNGTAPG